MTEGWSDPIEIALEQLDSSNSQNETQDALDSLIFAMQRIPSPAVIDSVMLRGWEPSDPKIWLDRLVSGQNSTGIIERTMLSISTIDLGDENFNNTRDASMAKLGALAGMQEVDYASALRSTLPVADHGDLSSADGPMLISFVVTTESDSHDGVALGEIQSKVNTWTGSIEIEISETGDETSSVFSYSQLLLGQNENLGRELGILNSVSLLILGTILWFSFRSKRDTGYVLGLTVLGIGATYGTSGALTAIGVPMTFNAAMNSIPVLLSSDRC